MYISYLYNLVNIINLVNAMKIIIFKSQKFFLVIQ